MSEEANEKKERKDYRRGFLKKSVSIKEREMLENIIVEHHKNSEEPETCF